MVAPIVIGGLMAGASLLSSFSSASLGGSAAKSAYGQSVYAAGLQYQAGIQEAEQYTDLADSYFYQAHTAEGKKRIAMEESRRGHKIISGRMRGQQQGLESGGTTRSMTVEQQEHVMVKVEKALEDEWDNAINSLKVSARNANKAANTAYINGVNNANATLYSGASTAAAYINKANMTMAMALPNAAAAGFSGYMTGGGSLGSLFGSTGTTTELGADRAANIASLFQY